MDMVYTCIYTALVCNLVCVYYTHTYVDMVNTFMYTNLHTLGAYSPQ